MSSESLLSQHENEEQFLSGRELKMEARAEHQKTKHYRSLYAFTTSTGAGTLVMVLFWILHYRGGFAWQSNPGLEFNWHPFLMFLGMIFMYSQSMLTYRTFRHVVKRKLKLLHASVHLLAFICSVIGLKAAFDSHNLKNPPIPNLYTMHSWIGLATVVIFSAQYLYGFISFLYPGLSMVYRRAFMPVHVAVGTAGFLMAVVAVITGLTEKTIWVLGNNYAEYVSEGMMTNFIALFTLVYGVMVLYLVNEEDYKRAALPEDEIALTQND
ncbi:transmembrane ascorbate-dependent reductase CYB561 isoform X2 [Aethina tumida]|uniref:transmembrane ascorbate-dependent reductase CYB561 isoform X2 n=1 Tax=Aethina tumida TaxID=116153 RepID=UPI00096B0518|nr:transmembrane ascorbate-dependent reductase CYB561 isoform X2 [Aethina tumida]